MTKTNKIINTFYIYFLSFIIAFTFFGFLTSNNVKAETYLVEKWQLTQNKDHWNENKEVINSDTMFSTSEELIPTEDNYQNFGETIKQKFPYLAVGGYKLNRPSDINGFDQWWDWQKNYLRIESIDYISVDNNFYTYQIIPSPSNDYRWKIETSKNLSFYVKVPKTLVGDEIEGTPNTGLNEEEIVSNYAGTSETDKSTLLAGDNYNYINYGYKWVRQKTEETIKDYSVEQTIQNFRNKYLLGIASDFSVFLKEDLTVYQSDSEGRVAIGGTFTNNADFNGPYHIGTGDFNNSTPLSLLLRRRNFSTLIAKEVNEGNGYGLGNNYYSYNMSSIGHPNAPMEDFDDINSEKKVVLNNSNNVDSSVTNIKGTRRSDKSTISENNIYVTNNLIDFDDSFTYLKNLSKNLLKQEDKFSIYNQGENLIIEYIGPEIIDRDSLYLNLNESDYNKFKSAFEIHLKNIPSLRPREVVENQGEMSNWTPAFLIINIKKDSTVINNINDSTVKNANNSYELTTYKNDWHWSKKILFDGYPEANQSTQISADGINNHIGATGILYNFADAKEIILGGSMPGTVLAPYADVTDQEYLARILGKSEYTYDRGHLSGALIANSFRGYTEFGYRPFDGTIDDILPGNLIVTKSVVNENNQKIDSKYYRNHEFEFNIYTSIPDVNNQSFSLSGIDGYGEVAFEINTDSNNYDYKATVKVKGSSSIHIYGLPEGDYYIEEDSSDYNLAINSHEYTGSDFTNKNFKIIDNHDFHITFTNHYKKTSIDIGNLVIEKEVVNGTEVEKTQKDYKFIISTTNSEVAGKTYSGLSFSNDGPIYTAELIIKGQGRRVVNNLPIGTYRIEEDKQTEDSFVVSYNPSNQEVTLVEAKSSIIKVTNTFEEDDNATTDSVEKRDLTIEKEVKGLTEFKDMVFNFEIESDEDTLLGEEFETNLGNKISFSKQAPYKATVSITGNGTITIKDLPKGNYKVTEKVDDTIKVLGYELETTSNVNNNELTLEETNGVIKFTNTYNKVEEEIPETPVGELQISKVVVSEDTDDLLKSFNFEVSLDTDELSNDNQNIEYRILNRLTNKYESDYKKASFNEVNGLWKTIVQLKNNQTAEFINIPADSKYKVEENLNSDSEFVKTTESNTGTILENETAYVSYTNTKNVDLEEGSLVIQKVVNGSNIDRSTQYQFVIKIDSLADGTYGNVTFKNGQALVYLRHLQQVVISGLPVNVTYSVSERESSEYSTSWSQEVDSNGVVNGTVKNSTTTLICINTLNEDEILAPEPEVKPSLDIAKRQSLTGERFTENTVYFDTEHNFITYEIEVTNTGDVIANNIIVTDTIPEGTELISGSTLPEASVENNVLTWIISELKAGESTTVSFTVNVNDEAELVENIAHLSYDVEENMDSNKVVAEIDKEQIQDTTHAPEILPDDKEIVEDETLSPEKPSTDESVEETDKVENITNNGTTTDKVTTADDINRTNNSTTSTSVTTESPKTGLVINIGLWIVLILGAASLLGIQIKRNKNN